MSYTPKFLDLFPHPDPVYQSGQWAGSHSYNEDSYPITNTTYVSPTASTGLYTLWYNTGGYAVNGTYSMEHHIYFDFSTNTWHDGESTFAPNYLTNTPTFSTTTSCGDAEYIYLWNNSGTECRGRILSPYSISSGPNVSSINETTIFVPSDTVSNTDFTLLKNGQAYSNTNISLSGPAPQLPSDARGYTYTITYNGNGFYDRTIDSKTFYGFYYDDSWTSSASSSRTTNANRILNVIGVFPTTISIKEQVGTNSPTSHIPSFINGGRVMKYTRGIYSSGTQTHTLTVYAVCSNETINGVDEITMKFLHKVEQYPPVLDGRSFSTSTHFIIGAQQSMSYSLTHNNITYTYTILDWIYSNEPEGDGYIAPTESTGHGSNYDDRFPLITTNLFNRQRSVYAIGMTHKDTWDLFL